jgi:hypothetical protein
MSIDPFGTVKDRAQMQCNIAFFTSLVAWGE